MTRFSSSPGVRTFREARFRAEDGGRSASLSGAKGANRTPRGAGERPVRVPFSTGAPFASGGRGARSRGTANGLAGRTHAPAPAWQVAVPGPGGRVSPGGLAATIGT